MKSHNPFHFRAISWLRGDPELHSSSLPHNELEEDSSGVVRVEGFFPSRGTWSRWSFAGFCALILGALLMMAEPPSATSANRETLDRTGTGLATLGAMAMLAGEAKRRHDRVPAVIELRSAESSPATPQSIAALRQANPSGASWLVSERDVCAEALASATEHDVRCFVLSSDGVRELRTPADETEQPAA